MKQFTGLMESKKQKQQVIRHSPLSSFESGDDGLEFEEEEEEEEIRIKGKERRRKLWKAVRYHQLTDYHSLPGFLRDNEYILGYYRSEWPLKQILLSTFTIHNETLNVWTHLIGFFLFLSLTIYTVTKIPNVIDISKNFDIHSIQLILSKCVPSLANMTDFHKLRDELKASISSMNSISSVSSWRLVQLLTSCLPEHFSSANRPDAYFMSIKDQMASIAAPLSPEPITRWPFFTFLGGAMFCLLASSLCHLLSCHSERLSYIMLRLDYAGIAGLIATSFYPPVYYSFICNPLFLKLYLTCITLLGVATIIFSLFPVFQNPEFRTIRAGLFFGMGVSGALPIFHKLILYWDQPEALETTGYEVLMGVLYGLGALVYALRIPERWKPGRFDIAGHSHQLFHLLVVAGAYTHYCDGLVYLKWRDRHGCH